MDDDDGKSATEQTDISIDTGTTIGRKAAAARRAAQLEEYVAAAADQRTALLKALAAPAATEPNRDYHAYHLGADLHYCGLASDDAVAMMGLLSTGPAHVGRLLMEAAATTPNIYVGRLWPRLIDADRDAYEARGRLVAWRRRWVRYATDHESWTARSGDAGWRERSMTSGQRYLVSETAVLLDLDIPEQMDRGAAHDWLAANGANVLYRKEPSA